MVKKIKCEFCKKRYVTQDSWKTEQEKKNCLTCFCFRRVAKQMLDSLQLLADKKKTGKEVTILFHGKNKFLSK